MAWPPGRRSSRSRAAIASRGGERRPLGQALLESSRPIRTTLAGARPAVHGLMDAPLVLEERAGSVADEHQGQGEVEANRGPASVELERSTEGLHGVVVLAEPELAPADQLQQVDLDVAAESLRRSPRARAGPPRRSSPSAGGRWRVLPWPRARSDRARALASRPSRLRELGRAEVLERPPACGVDGGLERMASSCRSSSASAASTRRVGQLLDAAESLGDGTLGHAVAPSGRAARSRRSARWSSCCSSNRSSRRRGPRRCSICSSSLAAVTWIRNPTSSFGTRDTPPSSRRRLGRRGTARPRRCRRGRRAAPRSGVAGVVRRVDPQLVQAVEDASGPAMRVRADLVAATLVHVEPGDRRREGRDRRQAE